MKPRRSFLAMASAIAAVPVLLACGADYVAKSKPDGYTFLIGAAGVVTNSLIRKEMPYADSDLVPVGMIAVAPSVIAMHPGEPAGNLKEFIAWAKAQGKDGVNWRGAHERGTAGGREVGGVPREDGALGHRAGAG
jgi:hypothetical protein